MSSLITILLSIPAVLIALTVHEYAHGYAAYKLGDPTARSLGRLSLNPFRHLDVLGVICMVFFRFGWAKPVPINTRYFKKPRRDMAITALCGPLSNFLLAFFGAFLYFAVSAIFKAAMAGGTPSVFASLCMQYTLQFLYLFHFLNLTLGLFNLIPLPPLDGSRIFCVFLPARAYYAVMKYEKYMAIALMLLLYFGFFNNILTEAASRISYAFFSIFYSIPGFL